MLERRHLQDVSSAAGRLVTVICLLMPVVSASPAANAQTAFPGAEGFGASARGGRGGEVHQVANLDDAGPGSLRSCVEAAGPRTCVFRVAGTIALASSILAREPFLTIAGQTAPGDGIALRLLPEAPQPGTPLIISGTHDVVVRHLRLRPGLSANPGGTDALTIENSHDVIIDQVSMTWAPDENLNAHQNVRNVTVQWSIMAEGLLEHSKGSLTCSEGWHCFNLTLHHNLYVSNRDRNPDIKTAPEGQLDFVNNVVHNPRSAYVELWARWGDLNTNIVGNTFAKGPSTNAWAAAIRYQTIEERGVPYIYANDNMSEVPLLADGTSRYLHPAPVRALSVVPEPADAAFESVLAKAGAWPRDGIDHRLVQEVRTRRGSMIRRPEEAGGWPRLERGDAMLDRDHDGMPDEWEATAGLDPDWPADRNGDADGDGYTNLEEYLDERARALIGRDGTSVVTGAARGDRRRDGRNPHTGN